MKQRLRVLDATRGLAGSASPKREAVERVLVAEPLVCIASDSAAGVDVACALIAGLRAAGRPSVVLTSSPAAGERGGGATRLREAGAYRVAECTGGAARDRALEQLRERRDQAVGVAVGVELSVVLRGLLTLALEPALDLDRSCLDLELRSEPRGVVRRIGEWLGQQLRTASRDSYQ